VRGADYVKGCESAHRDTVGANVRQVKSTAEGADSRPGSTATQCDRAGVRNGGRGGGVQIMMVGGVCGGGLCVWGGGYRMMGGRGVQNGDDGGGGGDGAQNGGREG
jgi:hypothetical protein